MLPNGGETPARFIFRNIQNSLSLMVLKNQKKIYVSISKSIIKRCSKNVKRVFSTHQKLLLTTNEILVFLPQTASE